MRSREEIELALRLAGTGLGAKAIARATGIPRSTVRNWITGHVPSRAGSQRRPDVPAARYSHLLGLYLGDGHVVALGRTYVLRVYCDAKYPGLIGEVVRSMRAVTAPRRVRVARKKPTNCVIVSAYWNAWPQLFPQHGPGLKHQRPIELEPWQRAITHAFPREFIRGLINSDGCRFTNPVRHGERLYTYPRYFFSNTSEDIKRLFCEHLDLLGIAWR